MPDQPSITIDRTALQPRLRRLNTALADLGLLREVGAGWATVGQHGFEFGLLADDSIDRLVCLLEDLAAAVGSSVGDPCITLADTTPRPRRLITAAVFIAPSQPPTHMSSVHPVVPV